MKWMLLAGRIIVAATLVERRRAVSVFVDVHAKEAGDPRGILIGKMKDLDLYENTAGRGVVECGKAPYRTYGISLYSGDSGRT